MERCIVLVGVLLATSIGLLEAATTTPDPFDMFAEDVGPVPDPGNNPANYTIPPLNFTEQVEYLRKYGYMNAMEEKATITSYDQITSAIKALQESADINPTGKMTEETKEVMRLPRCGMAEAKETHRMKRYTLRGTRWKSMSLTYKYVRYTNQLQRSLIDRIIRRAFKYWSDVSPLKFTRRTSGGADIDILFGARSHGDNSPFDGRGRTLAHAYYPGQGKISGDAHFDDDERWTDRTYSGTNLLQVAVHEFGHSLGLEHSKIQSAVMAPFYRGYQPRFKLHSDDINGIRAIYGRDVPTQTARPPTEDGCHKGFDAVTAQRARNGRTLTIAFKGQYYYTLGTKSEIRIRDKFRYLTSVDAAISSRSGIYNAIYLYLFKDSKLYVYLVRLYSRNSNTVTYLRNLPINRVVRGLPSNIDDITRWSRNGRIYAFKGDQYYGISGNRVRWYYPRNITNWNISKYKKITKIDASFTYLNRRTYFFVGSQYYRYSARRIQSDPGYPKSIGRWWRQCREGGNLEEEPDMPTDVEMQNGLEGEMKSYNTVLGVSGAPTVTLSCVLSALLFAFSTSRILLQ